VVSLPAPKNIALSRPVFGTATNESSQEGKRFDFWGMVQRRKWIIFIFTAIGIGAGFFYNANATHIYESYAVTLIQPKNHLMIEYSKAELRNTELTVLRHDKVIPTETILERCFNRYGLINDDYFKGKTVPDCIKLVYDNLEIVQNREEPNMFEMTFRCEDADVCQKVLTTINDCYEEYLKTTTIDEKSNIIDRVTALKNSYDRQLEDARNEYEATAKTIAGPRFDSSDTDEYTFKYRQNTIEQAELKKQLAAAEILQSQISAALNSGDQAIQEQEWRMVNDGIIKTGNNTSQFVISQRERFAQELNNLQLMKQMASASKGQNHPDMIAINARIAMQEKYIKEGNPLLELEHVSDAQKLKNYYVGLVQEIDTSKRQLAILKAEHDELLDIVTARAQVEFTLEQQREKMRMLGDLAQTIKTAMLEYSEANQDQMEGYHFQRLDRAEEGLIIWPHLPTILAIAGALGLSLGFGLSYLVDMADKTFHSPEEITSQLGIPLIGHIPVIDSSKRMQIENSFIDPVICVLHRPKSRNAEAFRAIRTAIYFNTQGKQNSVIQITSPTPGDGKSVVASNLAVSIAQSGKRVLLVDADMRRPTVHHSFGIKSDIGFSTVLQGTNIWQDVIYECEEIPGLSLLPSGKKPANPAELVTSPIVKELIDDLRKEYDFVILDTPPILAVTDPCPIAARVDGVILTLRIKKNIKISADRATEILHGLGANVIGVVVNGVGANTGYGSQYSYGAYRSGYSYNGYGYGYGYGSGKYYEDENHAPVPAAARIASNEDVDSVERTE
jgi:polysaccharide biosynthesis transport protein